VTIAIPSSNPRYFLESLDSALGQTYPHVEIVICDDSEGDAIPAMAASRAGRVELRYERNPQRLRARRNYQKCLALARGEYVKFLNDDDVLEPECVARLVRAFQEVPDLVLATSHRLRIDNDSRVMEDMPATLPAVARDVVVEGVSLANAVIMYGLNFIGEPSTALFRRSDFERRECLDGDRPFHFNGEEVRGAIDLAMWSRLLVQGNAVFLRDEAEPVQDPWRTGAGPAGRHRSLGRRYSRIAATMGGTGTFPVPAATPSAGAAVSAR
jgi:glycosyltransferase involved in cell wall biosynthesis